jgi:hypothetical protein
MAAQVGKGVRSVSTVSGGARPALPGATPTVGNGIDIDRSGALRQPE